MEKRKSNEKRFSFALMFISPSDVVSPALWYAVGVAVCCFLHFASDT